jgi:hypothetical protein
MFTEPRLNVIASSDGYSVEVLGRTGLCYREGARAVRIDSEVLVGEPAIGIWEKSIFEWDDGTAIGETQRNVILDNIRAAFRWQGHEIVVS